MSVVITAKIPKKLRDEARRYGINISKLVREALEREIRRRKIEEIMRLQREVRSFFEGIKLEEIVEAVRESRDER